MDAILTLAGRESGAFGAVDPGLASRVRAAVEWINARGPYDAAQLRAMTDQIKAILTTRLRIALDRERYPGIAEEKVEQPIFIIGFPRAGTTLLHSLLAEDPEVLKPLSWHLYSPSPPPGAGPVMPERIAYAQRQVEAWMDFCPAQKPMHPYIDKGAYQLAEDEEVFSLDFRSLYPYQFYKVPTLDSYVVTDPDMHGTFGFHREFLQHLQWNTGVRRWVCKGPSAQGSLAALFAAYPDALCVWPHRPMAEIYASIVSLSIVTYDAITGRPREFLGPARALAESLKAAFDVYMSDAMLDDPRILHVPFRELAVDPLAVIRTIYDRQGRTVGPDFERRIADWLAAPENAVDRYGRYPYSYEALGLDRQWVEDLFADYSRRFYLA